MRVHGVHTTIPFHEWLLAHPQFQQGEFSTRFIEREEAKLSEFLQCQRKVLAERGVALIGPIKEQQSTAAWGA